MTRHADKQCHCPYCDHPADTQTPFCQPCSVTIDTCPVCGAALEKKNQVCPNCNSGQNDQTGRNR